VIQEDFDRRPARPRTTPTGSPSARCARCASPSSAPSRSRPTSARRRASGRSPTTCCSPASPTTTSTSAVTRPRASPASASTNEDDEARAERRYTHVVETISATPWAITPDALQTIVGILAERADGHRLTDDEIRERIGTPEERAAASAPDGPVAVIGIYGPIVPRADMFSEVSGMASVQSLQKAFRPRSRPQT
jgi:hypothetical protein